MKHTLLGQYEGSPREPYLIARRMAGSHGCSLMEIGQPAGDFSDPPVDDLVLSSALISHQCNGAIGSTRFSMLVHPGDLYLTPPDLPATLMLEGPNAFRVLTIPKARVRGVLDGFERSSPEGILTLGRVQQEGFRSPATNHLLDLLWQDSRDASLGALYQDSLIIALVGQMVRLAASKVDHAKGGLAPWQIRRVQDFMIEHLPHDVSLDQLCELVDLSPAYFCRAFRRSVGLPPYAWLVRQRVARAQNLLRVDRRVTVASAALAVGYTSENGLIAAFRKVLGVTPRQWIRDCDLSQAEPNPENR